jgi:hypothetical protein
MALTVAAVARAQPATNDLESEIARYPEGWLESKSARYGMDITLDGKIWINADHYGDREDYAVAASDLLGATGRYRKAWVRGYHKRNPDVSYRESKRLVQVNCADRTWFTELTAYYDVEGRAVRQTGRETWSPVIPGTNAENWLRMICAD